MKTKAYRAISLIVALLVAVLMTVGYVFAWLVDRRQSELVISGTSAGAYFDSGDGSEETPFVIANPTHMHNLAVLQNAGKFVDRNGNPKKYYFEIKKTVNIINMSGHYIPPIGNDEYPFIGDFNGNGKTLANLRVTTDKDDLLAEYPRHADNNYEFSQAVGLFGMTGESSDIHNVILENPSVDIAGVGSRTRYLTDATTSAAGKTITPAIKAAGLAVGFVAGKCSSIGVRAKDDGSALDVNVTGYSTFNSILGSLREGLTSSVTGGGHGTGGSGSAFGASFAVAQLAERLTKIGANKKSSTASPYLPQMDYANSIPVPALGYKVPFTVTDASTYEGATAREVISDQNIGYDMGNQNKISSKKLNFTDTLMVDSNDGNHQYYLGGVTGKFPDNNNVPRWFYVQGGGWQNSAYMGHHGFAPISQEKYDSLPQNVKDLLYPAKDQSYSVMRIQAGYTQYSTAPIYANTGSPTALAWNYHGQISWMGKTYGKGFADADGYAVDENGNYYGVNGNLIGADGYDVDENGNYAAPYADFPYVISGIDVVGGVAYAQDSDGNVFYVFELEDGSNAFGILSGGYLKSGDGYVNYVVPVAGWTAPVTLIDADGYAMYADGVYYDASGHIVDGAYVKDVNGLYIPVDTAFKMPISQIVNGYAQDADGNYYGKITLNDRTVYCYLGEDGMTSGYDGWYRIDANNFIVRETNVDADGNLKYNDTDYYGTYNGQSGYIDANGYFYGANHVYVIADTGFNNSVTSNVRIIDVNGHAMTDGGVYYGKRGDKYGYLDGNYYYIIENGQKIYTVNDTAFTSTVHKIDGSGYAMTDDGAYYGRYREQHWQPYTYGLLESVGDKNYLKINGKYIATDGNYYDEFDSATGHIKADDTYFVGIGGKKLNAQGYVYDDSLDANGNVKGYVIASSQMNWIFNGYSACEDTTSEYYGYMVDSDGNPFMNRFDSNGVYVGGEGTPLKAWGYTEEDFDTLTVGANQYNYAKIKSESGTFAVPVEGEKFTVEEGEYITAETGTKSKAISGTDINGVEGEFILPKEIEKVKVVSQNDEIAGVQVKKADKVKLCDFKGGVALPNNGIWFKPSNAGTVRFVMFAQNDSEAFCLLKITREKATKENPFYFGSSSEIKVEKVMQQQLPKYVLFYYEIDVTPQDIENGNIEYAIMVDNNVKEEGSDKGTDYKGAYFLYLDIGASAAEDVSGIDREKSVSAVDFIYDGVEIKQGVVGDDGATAGDSAINVGDFIVKPGGTTEELYKASKTSVYFENLKAALNIVYIRLNEDSESKHSGKTICLEKSNPVPDTGSEVKATFTSYVCPTIGSGSSSSGGGSVVDPDPEPDPDTPTVSGVTVTPASATVEEGKTTTLTASVTMSDGSAYGGSIVWTSSDEEIATVENGVVTAKAAGTVTITATAGGESATCTVTVNAAQSGGTVNVTMNAGDYTSQAGKPLAVTGEYLSFTSSTGKNYKYVENNAAVGGAVLVGSGNGRDMLITAGSNVESITVTLKMAVAGNEALTTAGSATVTVPAGATVTYADGTAINGTITTQANATVIELKIVLGAGQSVTIESTGRLAFINATAQVKLA